MLLKLQRILLLIIYLFVFQITKAQVGIGTTTPDSSATLDITSTDKGLLIPRISLIDVTNIVTPINNPAIGLLIYNTNASVVGGNNVGFYYFDGISWVKFKLENGGISTDLKDIGIISAFPGVTYPNDMYLPLDGGTFNDVDYSEFAIFITNLDSDVVTDNGNGTFTLANWNDNGIFLRGQGGFAGSIGSLQNDATSQANNVFRTQGTTLTTTNGGLHNHNYTRAVANSQEIQAGTSFSRTIVTSGVTSPEGNHSHNVNVPQLNIIGGDIETRPINRSITWVIKVKPSASSVSNLTINNITDIGTDDQTIDTFNFNTGTNILTLEVEDDGVIPQTVNLSTLQDGTGTDDQTIDTFSFNTGTNVLTLEVEDDGVIPQTVNLSTLQDGTGTDNQNISGSGLSGTDLTIGIQNGTSEIVDLSSLQDGIGTDNQSIDTFSFNTGTNILTLEVEDDGVIPQTVNLSTLQDGTGTDNQNISGSGLSGTDLTIGIQNGTSEIVDLSSLQDGTGTDEQTIDTFSFNTGTNVLTLEVENDGVTAQTVNLSTLTDADWYVQGSTNNSYDINDNIYTNSNVNVNSGNIQINTGRMNIFTPADQSGGLSVYKTISNGGSSTYNNIESQVTTSSPSISIRGILSSLFGTGTNFQSAFTANVAGSGASNQRGVSAIFGNDNSSSQTGVHNYFNSDSPGTKYGLRNVIPNVTSTPLFGTFYGIHSDVSAVGNNQLYGAYTRLGIGSGNQYGYYAALNSGTGTRYGFYASIVDTGGGVDYGFYSDVEDTSNGYAAYFIGRTSLGNNTSNRYIMPTTDGAAGFIMQTDGSGQVSFIDPATIGDGTGTDNQNISGSGLSGTDLTIGIQNGTSEIVDLSSLQDGNTQNTLDQAYDEGGAGNGRTINTTDGALLLNGADGLEVFGAAANINITNTTENESGIYFSDSSQSSPQYAYIYYNSGSTNTLNFYNESTTPIMTIDDNQNVGIGHTSPVYKLDVRDSQATDYIAQLYNTHTGNNADGLKIRVGNTSPNIFNNLIAFYNGTDSKFGEIEGNGTGVTYNTTSDRRLKTNIQDISNSLELLDKIKPRVYEYKKQRGKKEYGFIAQELQPLYPQAVTGSPDSNVNIDPMMVDYSRLTPLLAAGIKELHQKIKTLETENALLKVKLEKLETLEERLTALENKPSLLLTQK